MCAYSNMIGQWHDPTWPYTPSPNPFAPSPNAIPWPTIVSDPALAAQMLEVLKRLDAIDKRLNNVDCKVEKEQKVKITRALKKIAKTKKPRSTSIKAVKS